MSSTVMVGLTVAVGTTLLRQTVNGDPHGRGSAYMRTLVGGFLLGAALFGVNEFAPGIASGFAILVMVTSLMVNGEKVFTSLAKSVA